MQCFVLGSHKGMCSNNHQVITHDKTYLGTKSQEACMAECQALNEWEARGGCEYHGQDQQCTIYNNSTLVDSGNGDEGYICQLLSGKGVYIFYVITIGGGGSRLT